MPQNVYVLRAVFLAAAWLLVLAAPVRAQDVPRNVIIILSDDHRYDFMGFMGKPAFLETPNMDRMAAEGAHLRNAFVSTALCSPSRATILTGKYAHKHGVVDNNRPIPPGTTFFPTYLQEAGYRTAFIGKWHMGHESDAPREGFDHWISYRGQGTYYDPVLNIDGARVERTGYTADIVTDYALDWLEQVEDEPFFLLLSHKSVHAMFEPAERHLGRYEDVPLVYPETMYEDLSFEDGEGPAGARDAGWPDWVRAQRNSWHGVDYMYHGQMDFDTFYRRYTETLLALDESIGRVLRHLERTGLDENTLVVYMSDNGFSFGEHGLIDKRHAYEESMRVPMLAWAPGYIAPGTVVEEMIQNIDVAPTVLDLAGLAVPAEMDGLSALPLLENKNVPWRNEILYEYYWEWNFPHTPTTLSLRTDRYKYIFYHGVWDRNELYDVEADPEERFNLIDDPAHRERVLDMRSRLFAKLDATDGLFIPLREPRGGQQADRRPEP